MSVGRKRRAFGVRTGRPALLGAAGGLSGVSQDASSLKYCPANSTEWGTVTTAAGVSAVSLGWGMQDLAGALAASVGAVTLASEAARQDYNQTVSGWARKGVLSRGDGWLTSDASLPDISTTSQLLLVYALQAVTSTGTDSMWLGTTYARTRVLSSGLVQAVSAAGVSASGAGDVRGAVRPFVLQVNRASSLTKLYTDQEKLSVAVSTVTGKGIYIVGSLVGDETTFLLGAQWQGAAAEMTDAQVKTLLQTLGWTIPWT